MATTDKTSHEIVTFIRERQGNVRTWAEYSEKGYIFHCNGNDGQEYQVKVENAQELSYFVAVADAELIKYM